MASIISIIILIVSIITFFFVFIMKQTPYFIKKILSFVKQTSFFKMLLLFNEKKKKLISKNKNIKIVYVKTVDKIFRLKYILLLGLINIMFTFGLVYNGSINKSYAFYLILMFQICSQILYIFYLSNKKKIQIINSNFFSLRITNFIFSIIMLFPILKVVKSLLLIMLFILDIIDLIEHWHIIIKQEQTIEILDKSLKISETLDKNTFDNLIFQKKIKIIDENNLKN